MNIAEAKEFIKDTVKLYLKKDEFGDYQIPIVRQRPIFLLGAPGIGKTAIMSQIASELDIALVSYSMTHHTRQSALGLPFIEQKEYGDKSVKVSEYTMSEIIASVYDTMEESGITEGILFLDEINCVSETLYPSMLQFLQYKVFGKHSVPEGWVVVTAGNPPEFNKAVREFDVVTLDRLKVIETEADYPAWKKYAVSAGIHGAVLSFIDANRDCFYKIETTAFGKNYVTARGWEDLSDIIYLYEEDNKPVTEKLIGQYIKDDTVVREFSAFYDLYNKYKRLYDVEDIFAGKLSDKTKEGIVKAPMDERLALTGFLSDKIKTEIGNIIRDKALLSSVKEDVVTVLNKSDDRILYIDSLIGKEEKSLKTKKSAGSLTQKEKTFAKKRIAFFKDLKKAVSDNEDIKLIYNSRLNEYKADVSKELERVDNLFESMAEIFTENSNEMLVLVTELTLDENASSFFTDYESSSYEKYNSLLLVGERREDLRKEILELI